MMFSHYTAVANLEMMANLSTEGDTQQGFDLTGLLAGMTDTGKTDEGGFDQLMGQANAKDITDKYVLDGLIRQKYPKAKTIFEALAEKFASVSFVEGCDYKGADDSGIPAAAELAKQADVVILCVGGKNGIGRSATSGEGIDSCTLELPGCQETLMRRVFEANPNMVIVHTDARPLISPWAYAHVPAILEGQLPNTYGGNAIADVLCGDYNLAGRTPVDVPRSVGHLPVYHNQQRGSSSVHDRHLIETGYIDSDTSVLALFGYGLSYTAFSYSGAELHADEHGNIVIRVRIKNTGNRDGEEVVQLYGIDEYASMLRLVHELIGFVRVPLQAGEEKTVEFRFNIDAMAFLDQNWNWVVEKGDFKFVLGSHSEDHRSELLYHLAQTKAVDPHKRTFYADSAIIARAQ